VLREGLAFFSDTYLMIVALVLFFLTFVGIVVWALRKSARKHYEDMARLPLDERNPE
jgi:cbb3-type cytochrome oxidase subunit 3